MRSKLVSRGLDCLDALHEDAVRTAEEGLWAILEPGVAFVLLVSGRTFSGHHAWTFDRKLVEWSHLHVAPRRPPCCPDRACWFAYRDARRVHKNLSLGLLRGDKVLTTAIPGPDGVLATRFERARAAWIEAHEGCDRFVEFVELAGGEP